MDCRPGNEVKDVEVKNDRSVVAKKDFQGLQLSSDNCYESEIVSSESELSCYDGNSGMSALKNFLEAEGREFSAETEFLRFYALPYVTDPKSHPSFQNLFTDTWISDLRAKLNQFLFEHSCGPSVAPQLLQVCNVFHNQKENTRGTTQSVLLSKYQKLRRNYNSLRSDHHNLIGLEKFFLYSCLNTQI